MSWKDLENRYAMDGFREQVCHGRIKRTVTSWKDLENIYVMKGFREQVCHGRI
jgi:hypothetical protein